MREYETKLIEDKEWDSLIVQMNEKQLRVALLSISHGFDIEQALRIALQYVPTGE